MPEITFPYAPGFADVPDSALAAENFAMGVHIGRINENVAMGMVRPEVFTGTYGHGETIALPVSPVDGYKYSRDELNYMWSLNGLSDKKTGVDSSNLPFWFAQWFVDQDTGVVTCEKYYSNDSGSKTQKTNDSVLLVYTIAARRKTTMSMSEMPWYQAHDASDYALDKALHTTPLTDLSRNAKFSIVASEAIYMGTYKSTDQVALPVSPVDGYSYKQSEVIWLWSWVWTTDGNSYTPPDHYHSQMHQMRASVAADGTVNINIHFYNSHDVNMGDAYGRIAVLALCQRDGSKSGRYVVQADIKKNFVSVLGPHTVGARFTNFKLNTNLPSDAVITGIYPTVRSVDNVLTCQGLIVWGNNLSPLWIGGVPGDGYIIATGGQHYDTAGSSTDISLIDQWSVKAYITRTTPISGLTTLFSPTDQLLVEEVGFAIYYSSAAPTIDGIMTPPVAVPPGHGVAWAIPTSATSDGTAFFADPYLHQAKITKGTLVDSGSGVAISGGSAWAWVDSADVSAGFPLRTNLVAQINENANVAVLRPEFFDAGNFVHGQTIPVSVSPIDGYTYAREECVYMWEIGDTGNNTSGMIRILTWNAWVNASGYVSIDMCHLRDGGHIAWDHEGTLRVKVMAIRSAAHSVPTNSGSNTSASGTVPPDIVVDGTTIVMDPETGVISATGFGSASHTEPLCWNGEILFYNGDVLMIGVDY